MQKVVSSGVCEPTASATAQAAFYTGFGAWPASQYSEIKILAMTAGSNAAPIVLESGAASRYLFNLTGPTGSPVSSILYAGVAGHNIGAVTLTVNVGDLIRL